MMAANGKKIWMDGRLVDFAHAQVHVLNHTLHYGVGVFEGIRAYPTARGGAVFRLKEHVARLIASAKFYHMPIPYSAEEIEQAILETQVANHTLPSYIRPLVYRGEPALGVKNLKGKVSLAIAVIPAKKYLGDGSDLGVRAKISPFRKPHSDALPSFAKAAGNYLSSYLAGADATQDGYDEAILLDQNGYVAEGTGENVFVVRDGTVYTPGLESDILLGITRDTTLRLAADLGPEASRVELLSVNTSSSPPTRRSSRAPTPSSPRSARSATTRSAPRRRARSRARSWTPTTGPCAASSRSTRSGSPPCPDSPEPRRGRGAERRRRRTATLRRRPRAAGRPRRARGNRYGSAGRAARRVRSVALRVPSGRGNASRPAPSLP